MTSVQFGFLWLSMLGARFLTIDILARSLSALLELALTASEAMLCETKVTNNKMLPQ